MLVYRPGLVTHCNLQSFCIPAVRKTGWAKRGDRSYRVLLADTSYSWVRNVIFIFTAKQAAHLTLTHIMVIDAGQVTKKQNMVFHCDIRSSNVFKASEDQYYVFLSWILSQFLPKHLESYKKHHTKNRFVWPITSLRGQILSYSQSFLQARPDTKHIVVT